MIDFSRPYRVVRAGNSRFDIDVAGERVICVARKKIKRTGDIIVGDLVYLENLGDEVAVKSVVERRNSLIRPAVANIDQIAVLIAPVPEPDFFLIDKLILNCHARNIDCILCVNKNDIIDLYETVKYQYADAVSAIVSISAVNNDVELLKPLLYNKTTCFAGQSATGKSTLVNTLLGSTVNEVGDLSARISRGKNTTTSAVLMNYENGGYIVDTPGFSMLDVFEVGWADIDLYYPEYLAAADKCKYHRCSHTVEPECEIKRMVECGELSAERYDRYVTLYKTLKETKRF